MFAIAALERSSGELSLSDYAMHRRELHIQLGNAVGPPEGRRFSANAPTRLHVEISRHLRDRLASLSPASPGALDLLVERALDAGLVTVERQERRRRARGPRGRAGRGAARATP